MVFHEDRLLSCLLQRRSLHYLQLLGSTARILVVAVELLPLNSADREVQQAQAGKREFMETRCKEWQIVGSNEI